MLLLLVALLCSPAAAETNVVDRWVLEKSARDKVPVAVQSSDSEFLRRIYLDLTGRLPEPDVARKFLADKDPAKRNKAIENLFPPLPTEGKRSVGQAPFLDRWTYFFCD